MSDNYNVTKESLKNLIDSMYEETYTRKLNTFEALVGDNIKISSKKGIEFFNTVLGEEQKFDNNLELLPDSTYLVTTINNNNIKEEIINTDKEGNTNFKFDSSKKYFLKKIDIRQGLKINLDGTIETKQILKNLPKDYNWV